ncbi:VanZ family protein [Listeria ivanovii]|uniref:VanZ-like domain-containing protein n=1 Tax=Listeria ivanovii (strain ATCC BAA-678 / PAM 55) TaxID=881621 RepID=G2ZAV3_LISIP|nr:VanZ family protein [Listeria ivanovii]AHI56210.1 antibiotic resistance protein VanZ [Listeria ivanovii WSLC3009]AIS65641.1 antibiotic resistance protein VanZ [Listeria ivanovii subsp. ivanovii]MBC1760753.1 VanZ family protein [Listeria ivanovii]MBK3915405.1 VanZ family protein [Listeria ivanovii subsp. ivanovii]MBK3922533.1 VanZ family protein [Listeria ivanovii subsp. ivanovii]
MQVQKCRFFVLLLPALYLLYGVSLALQFGNNADLMNTIANSCLLFIATIILTKMAKLKNWLDFIWFCVFILYIFILLHLVAYISIGDFVNSTYTGDFHIQKEMINLIPFTTIENTFRQTLPTMPTIIQIIGNILLLSPLSFFLLYFKITDSGWKALLVVFLTSCGIELLQFVQTTMITGFESMSLPPDRSTDVDDIILNTLSGLFGVLLAYMIPPVRKRIKKRR